MRVLVVHNQYLHRGGEDSVVNDESALLRSNGFDVMVYCRSNEDIASLPRGRVALETFWSNRTVDDIKRLVSTFRPDVIHSHNTFPLISPSLYWVADRLAIPVVQTLHNFRLFCPQAMFLRNGIVCEDCLGRVPWRAVTRSCYRGSTSQTAVLAGMLVFHRLVGTWGDKVARYIALNEFCRMKFLEAGLPENKVVVKPNFVDIPRPPLVNRRSFLFVGRLSAEKGLCVLRDAAEALYASRPDDAELKIDVAGTGPDDHLLKGLSNVQLLGGLNSSNVKERMYSSTALVLPSIWYENFPRTLVEAFACGLPVIASRLGALAELIQDGVTGILFEPGSSVDLAEKMKWAADNPSKMQEMGRNARSEYEVRYSPGVNFSILRDVYISAVNEVRAAKR